MSFIIYDLVLLVIFVLLVSIFLYTRRTNLKKEGLLFLYRTSWGIKVINNVGTKYKKTLKILGYISITLGYFLMIGVIYLFYNVLKIYFYRPDIVTQIKVPPIMPLVPYIDKVVPNMPPFYFTYWIVILAIIAITHEFAHGIFAARDKIKIKNTGFGFFPFFLPVFLAAFVELDEKRMEKKSKISQMMVLSAGTFANVLTAIFFFAIIWIFFSFAFIPSGVTFDTYAYNIVDVGTISTVNGIILQNNSYDEILKLADKEKFNDIKIGNEKYLATKDLLEKQRSNTGKIILYYDSPIINSGILPGTEAILEINNIKIKNREEIGNELSKYSPGDEINIKTKLEDKISFYKIVLGKHPEKENTPWLGIGFLNNERGGIMGKINSVLSFKKPNVYYQPKFNGISEFVYNLLWWIVLISISVALVNMLPVGIFDGGRFFYLTMLGILKDSNRAKKCFSFTTYLFLFLLLLLMIFWALSFFK